MGSYVALSKSLVLVFPVFLLAWLRFGIGALAMLHWLRPRLGEVPLTSQVQRLLFLESFLGNFLFSLFMLYGISLTTAVSAGVVMAAIPAMVGLLSWIFLGERINTQTALALTCAGLGIALLGLGREESSAVPQAGSAGNQWLGNLFIFCAVICEAAYAVIGKKLTQNLTPKRISAITGNPAECPLRAHRRHRRRPVAAQNLPFVQQTGITVRRRVSMPIRRCRTSLSLRLASRSQFSTVRISIALFRATPRSSRQIPSIARRGRVTD